MDEPLPRPEDLSELEQRLSAWRPAAAAQADRMLFAAGRASAPRAGTPLFWPAASACLALLAVALGGWLAAERGERLALAEQLRRSPSPVPAPPSVLADGGLSVPDAPPPDNYLEVRRALERDPDAELPHVSLKDGPPGPLPPGPPMLQVRPAGRLPDL